MLSYDDPIWASLEAGYRTPTDLRPLLRALETTTDLGPAWAALWTEIYHQGDVGIGSYVAVPHLVRIHRLRGDLDWNTYALVASVDVARRLGNNPALPEWVRVEYNGAVSELAEFGMSELLDATDQVAVRSILSVVALAFGAARHGQLLLEYSGEELAELIDV